MAELSIDKYTLLVDRDATFTTGKVVHVVWDNGVGANEIKVYLLDDPDDLSPTQVFTGPSLGFPLSSHTRQHFGLTFCNGSIYNYFQSTASVFPYATHQQVFDSATCQTVTVCDLSIADNPTITPASTTTSNDGVLTITATSSNGPSKAALFDFSYETEGEELVSDSVTFSDLYAAPYKVWVKDSIGCVDTINITIPATDPYGQKYTMEWSDNDGKNGFNDHKIEVYQKNYLGSVSEMQPSGEPYQFQVHADGEDKFHVIRATSITFSPISVTDGQYQEFFTEDDREYLIKYYLDTGAGYVLKWQGFVIPFLYQEPHLAPPYPVSIQATCGLANLKDLDFVDASGNNYRTMLTAMQIVSSMLSKLDLAIEIRSGINMYEENFDSTDTDDPLTQAYYDTLVYYSNDGTPEKCDVVIRNILKEYGATISQSDAVWLISRPEELIAGFDYREFTGAGVYDSNSSLDPVSLLSVPTSTSRFAWKDRSQHLEILPSYGTINIIQTLIAKPSLLYSYGFEENDFPEGSNTPKDWNISITEGSGIQWGRVNLDRGSDQDTLHLLVFESGFFPNRVLRKPRVVNFDRGDSKSALRFDFGTTRGSANLFEKEVNLYTTKGYLDCSLNDIIVLKFDYFILSSNMNQQRPWYRLKFKIKVGTRYWDSVEVEWTESDPGYQNIYLTKFESFDTFEISLGHLADGLLEDQAIELRFIIDNGFIMDHTDLATGLDAEETTSLFGAEKRLVSYSGFLTGGELIYFFYELEYSESGADGFEVRVPDDFDLSTNPKVWRKKAAMRANTVPIYQLTLDNIILKVLPGGLETPAEKVYPIVINDRNKRTLDVEIFHGDYPPDIVNAKHAYSNIIKRLDDSEYVGTQTWSRSAFSEGTQIQKILLSTLVAQFRKYNRRLTGNLIGDVYMSPYSVLQDTEDGDRLYLVQGFTQMANMNEYTVDLYELKNAETTDVVTPFGGAFDPQAFGISYD